MAKWNFTNTSCFYPSNQEQLQHATLTELAKIVVFTLQTKSTYNLQTFFYVRTFVVFTLLTKSSYNTRQLVELLLTNCFYPPNQEQLQPYLHVLCYLQVVFTLPTKSTYNWKQLKHYHQPVVFTLPTKSSYNQAVRMYSILSVVFTLQTKSSYN